MKKTIYLHIGVHKTGTTTIQNHFDASYDNLISRGMLYPKQIRLLRNDKLTRAHNGLATAFGFGNNPSKLKLKPGQFQNVLIEEANNSGCNKIFISSEAFCTQTGISKIESFKNEFNEFEIKVILFVRRQDQFLESVYQEIVKNGGKVDPDNFFTRRLPAYKELISQYAECFGKQNMFVVNFNDAVLNHDIMYPLSNLLKIELPPAKKKANKSLSKTTVSLIRQINIKTNFKHSRKLYRYFQETGSVSFNNNNEQGMLMTKEQLKEVYNKSIDTNKWIKENYFPQKEHLFDWNIKKQLDEHVQFEEKVFAPKLLDEYLGKVDKEYLNIKASDYKSALAHYLRKYWCLVLKPFRSSKL